MHEIHTNRPPAKRVCQRPKSSVTLTVPSRDSAIVGDGGIEARYDCRVGGDENSYKDDCVSRSAAVTVESVRDSSEKAADDFPPPLGFINSSWHSSAQRPGEGISTCRRGTQTANRQLNETAAIPDSARPFNSLQ